MSDTSGIGLTLVFGPANSGKLGRVLRWWEERLERGLRPLIVVPTAPDASALSTEMAVRRGALVGQSPAVTFDGLVKELLGRTPAYAGSFERSLLVAHLLHRRPPNTPGFSVRFPGTVGVAAGLLEELSDSGRPPDQIAQVLARWAAADRDSSTLAADIGRLLADYSGLRDRLGLAERSDAAREALAPAGAWAQPLAFYGFTSFTQAQRKLVEALTRSTEVLLVLDHERLGGRAVVAPDESARWEALAAAIEDMPPNARAYLSPEIAYLERHFLDDGVPDGAPLRMSDGDSGSAAGRDGGVRFHLASGRRNEAELAAQEVAALIAGGMAPGEIAVVVRSTKAWGTLMDDVFASCDIPCQVEERLELGETAFGYALLTGLRGVAAADATAVLAYLRGPFSSLTLEQTGDIEAAYLRGSSRGIDALTRCVEAVAPGTLAPLERAVVRGSDGAALDLDAAAALARHMIVNSYGAAGNAVEDVAADARALRAFQSAMAGLVVHRDAGALPVETLRTDVLLPALERVAVPSGPIGSPDAVQVLTAQRARARRFQAVFILGLVEGEFPGRPERPGLLTAAQRARLDGAGGGLLSARLDQEEVLFAWAVSRAWKLLVLSSRDADDGGGYAGQSYYWTRCRSLLGRDREEPLRRTLAEQVYAPACAPSRRHYLRACAARDVAPHPGCGVASRPRPWWRRGGIAGLGSEEVLDELGRLSGFSPSAIETYLRCPFAWFIGRVVGAESTEALVDDRLVGEMLHTVLRDAFRQFEAEGLLPLTPQRLERANEMAAAVVERLTAGEDCPGADAERKVAGWRLKRLASVVFSMEAEAAAAFVPTETEVAVGGESGVDIGGVAIKGRIDRVDTAPGGDLFIVDYKSGGAPKKSKIGTEEGLQLPLYMLALAAERPGCRVVGGAYLSPSGRERSGVVEAGCEDLPGSDSRSCRTAEEDDLEALLGNARALATQAAEGMRSGTIVPPPDRECAAWCELGPICRARRGQRRW